MQAKSFRIEGIPNDPSNWDVTICSLGAFGTIYEHKTPVTALVNLQQGYQAADLTIEHVESRPDVKITNVLDINLRQKVGSELQWIQISNDAVAATLSFDLSPPLGKYQLILESIDLNSPLISPTVLKTNVITVNVYDTNQGAFEYGVLSEAGQTNLMSLNYELHSGN